MPQYTFEIRVTVSAPTEVEAFRKVNMLHDNPTIVGLVYVSDRKDHVLFEDRPDPDTPGLQD